MRRMIPSNKARVLDNLAVNANGTAIEVDGNVAFESIENIGHLVDGEPIIKEVVVGDPGITLNLPTQIANYPRLFKGVKELTGFEQGGPSVGMEGDVVYDIQLSTLFAKINGQMYNNTGLKNFTLKGDNITKGDGYQYISGNMQLTTLPSEKVFEPFFTEAQYQALLASITNK